MGNMECLRECFLDMQVSQMIPPEFPQQRGLEAKTAWIRLELGWVVQCWQDLLKSFICLASKQFSLKCFDMTLGLKLCSSRECLSSLRRSMY